MRWDNYNEEDWETKQDEIEERRFENCQDNCDIKEQCPEMKKGYPDFSDCIGGPEFPDEEETDL